MYSDRGDNTEKWLKKKGSSEHAEYYLYFWWKKIEYLSPFYTGLVSIVDSNYLESKKDFISKYLAPSMIQNVLIGNFQTS